MFLMKRTGKILYLDVLTTKNRLFELGFADQLQEIMKRLSDKRQTLLFSATLPSKLVEFARAGLSQPVITRLDTDTSLSENLKLAFFTIRPQEKTAALLYLLKEIIPRQQQTIIFTATRLVGCQVLYLLTSYLCHSAAIMSSICMTC